MISKVKRHCSTRFRNPGRLWVRPTRWRYHNPQHIVKKDYTHSRA